MVSKSDFAPIEWARIVQAPLLAGFAVSCADPSSFIGSIQESLATAKLVVEGTNNQTNPLILAVCQELATSNGRADAREGLRTISQAAKIEDMKERSLEALKDVANILAHKAPQDAHAFKDWLKDIATKVAEAGTEGGFLGFGGIKVSDLEKATLDEIAAILAD
jgi:hypothetical protein